MRNPHVRDRRNMSEAERWVSVAAGLGLATYGLTRQRRMARWMLAGFGALLVRRGASGHCHTYELFGINLGGTHQDT